MRHQQDSSQTCVAFCMDSAERQALDPASCLGQLLQLILADFLHIEAALLHADDELLRRRHGSSASRSGVCPDIVLLHQEARLQLAPRRQARGQDVGLQARVDRGRQRCRLVRFLAWQVRSS